VLPLGAILVTLLIEHTSANRSSGTGSGVSASQARSLPQFTRVALAGANNVVIGLGSAQSVVVHADSNLLSRLTTQVRPGTLVIGNTTGDLNPRTAMYVTVSVTSLDAITLQGGQLALTVPRSYNVSVRA
jgi:hypothetical protein